ncbi:MAG: hypothetical protein AAF945_04425 [Actinomycetota bacterium]
MSDDIRTATRAAREDQLGALADLEEERRFLLRSLKDLEREHAAGDVDDDDFETLEDGYTRRAAEVIRAIEDGKRQLPGKTTRSRGRTFALAAATVVVAIGIGVALAQAWGDRGSGQEITGFSPGDTVRETLTAGRAALSRGDFGRANQLFADAMETELERGFDNPEPLTYFGWTLALGTRNNPDADESAEQIEVALLALQRAIEIDDSYADPHCYTALIEHSFREDPDAALPFLDVCEASDPPAEVAELVDAFAADIRGEAEPSAG